MQRGGKNSSSRRCLARRETLSFESGTRRREGRKGKKRRIESGLFKACFAGFQWRPFFERVPDYIRTFERGFGWWSLPLLKSYLFRRKRKGRPARWRGGEEGVEIGVRTAAWRLTNWTRGWILGYRAVKKKKRKKKNVRREWNCPGFENLESFRYGLFIRFTTISFDTRALNGGAREAISSFLKEEVLRGGDRFFIVLLFSRINFVS